MKNKLLLLAGALLLFAGCAETERYLYTPQVIVGTNGIATTNLAVAPHTQAAVESLNMIPVYGGLASGLAGLGLAAYAVFRNRKQGKR